MHMEVLAAASQGPREAEGNTESSTLARGHALLARHRTGLLFSSIFTLCCFNWVQERIELSQEKGRKRKRKGPRLSPRCRANSKRAKRGQGSLWGRARGRSQGGKGRSRLHGLGAAGALPSRALVNHLRSAEENNVRC